MFAGKQACTGALESSWITFRLWSQDTALMFTIRLRCLEALEPPYIRLPLVDGLDLDLNPGSCRG